MIDPVTAYHASYFAHELTRRFPSDSTEKFTATLIDARVDLKPHQVEAALFAFRSPLSKGAILADEVGLGKTIEAGLVLSQKWAEGQRRILVITPSSLRQQWVEELADKFYLPSIILESGSFASQLEADNPNPFRQDSVVICSYHFAMNQSSFIQRIHWDLVVIDEAHKLRNVYRTKSKIAVAIQEATAHAPKLLLTATPLQNNLMEVYGLVNLIDSYIFGDVKSFRSKYQGLLRSPDLSDVAIRDNFDDFKQRLSTVIWRTLRRDVLEYIRYTSRIPITQEFKPTSDEQKLYESVVAYLRRDHLYALPASQRHLMVMILLKLLASSTFAIAGTLKRLVQRLDAMIISAGEQSDDVDVRRLGDDIDDLDDVLDEWGESQADDEVVIVASQSANRLPPDELEAIKAERDELQEFADLASSISENAKGQALLDALKKGFAKLSKQGANDKAIIFTESKRTQQYLYELLSADDYAGDVVLFSGDTGDKYMLDIYHQWLDRYRGTDRITGSREVDIRTSVIDHFRERGRILIATEAASEGINLQFCSLVVNYDLPWNPQRVEQRIGRCHRYGQEYDVIVVNFLNRNNRADVRVFELLNTKFRLFDGVFGASDEVLGSIESGVDFERRLIEILQQYRTAEEIDQAFDALQAELESSISQNMQRTQEKLLENFDLEVQEKLRISQQEGQGYISKFQDWFWKVTRHVLWERADFDNQTYQFEVPQDVLGVAESAGRYVLGGERADYRKYRLSHPLGEAVLSQAKRVDLPTLTLSFNYSDDPRRIASVKDWVGKQGVLRLSQLSVSSFEDRDYMLFAGMSDSGQLLPMESARRFFDLDAEVSDDVLDVGEYDLDAVYHDFRTQLLDELHRKDQGYFRQEVEKLQRWYDDRVFKLETDLEVTKRKKREKEREATKMESLEAVRAIEQEIKALSRQLRRQRQEIFDIEDAIEEERDLLIGRIEERLQQKISETDIFTIYWRVI